MPSDLIPPTALFRFSIPCRYLAAAGSTDLKLDESYRLPNFGALDGAPDLVDLRGAWSEQALQFQLTVRNKRQAPWCRENRLDESDGLRIWIDTRDTHNIHRASRFCHQFIFLPSGGGQRLDQPVADQLLINRARENAQPIRIKLLKAAAQKTKEGYEMTIVVPTEALTGFDSAEHTRLGFFWCVYDRELGAQPMALTRDFPFDEDPSQWATLELVKG